MKSRILLAVAKHLGLFILAASALAQAPTPVPKKKDPFAGFSSSLDKRSGPVRPPALPAAPLSTGSPGAPSAAPSAPQTAHPAGMAIAAGPASGGIMLGAKAEDHLSESSGGQTGKIDDLEALLKPYGRPQDDTGAHPDTTVYEGATIPGAPTNSCRICYLAPLYEAEKVILRSPGIVSHADAVVPGFPRPLALHTYDIRAGIYNRLTIVTDKSAQQQVVSLVFKSESTNFHPACPPFVKPVRDWHTSDYVGTVNRGKPGIIIDARIKDLRASGHFIIANTSFNDGPLPVDSFDKTSPNATATWYIPEPLINMILDRIAKQNRH